MYAARPCLYGCGVYVCAKCVIKTIHQTGDGRLSISLTDRIKDLSPKNDRRWCAQFCKSAAHIIYMIWSNCTAFSLGWIYLLTRFVQLLFRGAPHETECVCNNCKKHPQTSYHPLYIVQFLSWKCRRFWSICRSDKSAFFINRST